MTEDIGDISPLGVIKSRLMAEKCETCIFRPAATDIWGRDVGERLEEEAMAEDAFIACHSTYEPLKRFHQDADSIRPAMCRGFYDRNRHHSQVIGLITALWGFKEVTLPPKVQPSTEEL